MTPTLIAIGVAAAVLLPLGLMALYVEDWSRDLATNRAATDIGASHPLMRPITQRFTVERLDEALEGLCRDLPHWSQPDPPKPLPTDANLPLQGDAIAERHLVRTTGVMRYKDDLWLVVGPNPEEPADAEDPRWRLHIVSRSRVGKGDLGQNPRNIRELNQALVSRLIVGSPPPTKR
ncbi:MAG: DUF1499 domain-containing protein [Planctomycetota bacterium]